jgi:hypothetical protein
MTDASQPRMARGTKLSAVVLAAALFALLAFAPFASAAPDPVGSGKTTLALKSGVVNAWKKQGVKVSKVSPATLKGSKATFTVTGGSLDPTTGLGTVNLGGGLKFKAGKKSAKVTALVLDTSKKTLTAKVAGKKMKMATVAGNTFARNGFGVNLSIKSLKLTSAAAKQLNKKLGFTGKKGKAKGHKRASLSKGAALPFKANQVLGSATSETQPSTVTLVPGGNATLTTALPTVTKLAKDNVKIETVAPTTAATGGPPPAYNFPISGGTISPTATAGIVQTAGGLKLSQVWEPGKAETTLSLNAIYVDLGAKTATVEVVVESKGIDPKLNLGVLGRSSIADISLTGATITANPATRTVSVQNASATLQAVTAEVLNSIFAGPFEAIAKMPAEKFAAGDPLGTFSFTAQTQ